MDSMRATHTRADTSPRARRARLTPYIVLALVGVALAGALVGALLIPAPTPPPGAPPPLGSEVGDRAPDVSATTLDGAHATLGALRGHPVVLTFWATWCPACRMELPLLERMARRHPEWRIVAIESDSERAAVLASLRQLHLARVVVWRDPAATTLHQRYHTHGIPATFVIDADGQIQNSFLGTPTGEDALELALFGTAPTS